MSIYNVMPRVGTLVLSFLVGLFFYCSFSFTSLSVYCVCCLFVNFIFIVHSGNTFQFYMIGLAGLFIGLGEIFGEVLL